MLKLTWLLLPFGLWFSSTNGLPNLPVNFRDYTTLPSSKPTPQISLDIFYTPPANYQEKSPGSILRIRLSPGNLASEIGNCSGIYNILFRTTDSNYLPSWAVTTVFVPLRPSQHQTSGRTNRTSLLSYQIPYNTDNVQFSPSYIVDAGDITSIPTDIAEALSRGWWVNVPDFEGPLASFGAGVQEGHATLDSVRAVLSAGLGVDMDSRYAMWGYSGGSLASEWAAELQVEYAPELNFAGMAIGGMVPIVKNLITAVNAAPYAGLIPLGLLGITSQYPQVAEYMTSRLRLTGLYNRTGFLAAKNMTTNAAFAAFANQDMYQYFIDGQTDLDAPILQKVLNRDGVMGFHGVPQMPMFMYKAIADEASLVGDTDALVDKYCGIGANILYQRNTIGNHIAEYTNGVARSFAWLGTVLDGTYSTVYSPLGCTVQNVSVGAV